MVAVTVGTEGATRAVVAITVRTFMGRRTTRTCLGTGALVTRWRNRAVRGTRRGGAGLAMLASLAVARLAVLASLLAMLD